MVKASSSNGAPAAAEKPAPPAWKLPVFVFLWYAFNIIFNIVNKSGLNIFPCPWFISTWQLGEAVFSVDWHLELPLSLSAFPAAASGLFMCFVWLFKLHPVPKVRTAALSVGELSCLSLTSILLRWTRRS